MIGVMEFARWVWNVTFHPLRTAGDVKTKTAKGLYSVGTFASQVLLLTALFVCVFLLSLFLYIAFYYSYIPNLKHSRPVHFTFKGCDEKAGICSFPTAEVSFTKHDQLLTVGQEYKIFLDLEMPESDVNKNLGMFMCCAHLYGSEGKLSAQSCRSTMLQYKSALLNVVSTLLWIPANLMGLRDERQTVHLELFANFVDDQKNPFTHASIQLQSRFVEVYSASMHIHANFTGLRYAMYNWRYLSATVGVCTNLLFVGLVFALSIYHLRPVNELAKETSFKNLKQEPSKRESLKRDTTEDLMMFKQEAESEQPESEHPESECHSWSDSAEDLLTQDMIYFEDKIKDDQ